MVRVRKVETGVVIGVSEVVAEGLCISGEFERVEDEPKPAKEKSEPKAASRRARAKK